MKSYGIKSLFSMHLVVLLHKISVSFDKLQALWGKKAEQEPQVVVVRWDMVEGSP